MITCIFLNIFLYHREWNGNRDRGGGGRRDYGGGGGGRGDFGGRGGRDRFSPPRHDLSPPLKRMRPDWCVLLYLSL